MFFNWIKLLNDFKLKREEAKKEKFKKLEERTRLKILVEKEEEITEKRKQNYCRMMRDRFEKWAKNCEFMIYRKSKTAYYGDVEKTEYYDACGLLLNKDTSYDPYDPYDPYHTPKYCNLGDCPKLNNGGYSMEGPVNKK